MGSKLKLALAMLLVSVLLAACGGNSGSSGDSVAETVEPTGAEREIIIQGSNFKFDQEEYIVSVGEAVKIIYQDVEGAHGVEIEKTNIRLRNNQDVVVRFSEAGTYQIYCSVYCGSGHANMKAKLVVQ